MTCDGMCQIDVQDAEALTTKTVQTSSTALLEYCNNNFSYSSFNLCEAALPITVRDSSVVKAQPHGFGIKSHPVPCHSAYRVLQPP